MDDNIRQNLIDAYVGLFEIRLSLVEGFLGDHGLGEFGKELGAGTEGEPGHKGEGDYLDFHNCAFL